MPVFTIDAGAVCRMAGRDPADEEVFTVAVEVVCGEQDAWEARLHPEALAAATTEEGLYRLLAVNVAKLLAAELLERLERAPGGSGNIQAVGVTISSVPDHAGRLRSAANEALAPYWKRARSASSPNTPSPAGREAQRRLFGKGAAERVLDDG